MIYNEDTFVVVHSKDGGHVRLTIPGTVIQNATFNVSGGRVLWHAADDYSPRYRAAIEAAARA
jgi:hypothetical protein